MHEQVTVNEIPHLHLPDVCTESPLPRKAFCREHCQFLKENAPEIPTGLREFLKYSGVTKDDDDQYDKGINFFHLFSLYQRILAFITESSDKMLSKVEEAVSSLPKNSLKNKSAVHAQGMKKWNAIECKCTNNFIHRCF